MFRAAVPAVEAVEIEQGCDHGRNADLIPLSVLHLDLPTPATGWEHYLTDRGIEVVADDIGRKAISRPDARQLLAEHAAAESRRLAMMARVEQQAIEADRLRRAQIWAGAPAVDLAGANPGDAMLAAAKASQPRRQSVLEASLANSDTMTYHEWPTEDES